MTSSPPTPPTHPSPSFVGSKIEVQIEAEKQGKERKHKKQEKEEKETPLEI